MKRKVILLVLDSVGIGAAPDASDYGDGGSATLPNMAEAVGGLRVPVLESLGLGRIPEVFPEGQLLRGVIPVESPKADWGAMRPRSEGKDTITGHWEMAGLCMQPGFHLFPPGPPSFPADLVAAFEKGTGRRILGNKAASGTGILDELGPEHQRTGYWIAYTSADSVFQIAAHVDVIPLDELYQACEFARTLCDAYRVGRVIARPFSGEPGAYIRTPDRKDFVFRPEEPTMIERLVEQGIPVYAVGKIDDIFAGRGVMESDHTGTTERSQGALLRFTREKKEGLIFANFIDFDMVYGHRRDARGYAEALEQTDDFLADYLPYLDVGDVLIITADHGNDPTFFGTDHTREYVPLLVYHPRRPGKSLGLRDGFYDVAQSVASAFGVPPMPRGVSFIERG